MNCTYLWSVSVCLSSNSCVWCVRMVFDNKALTLMYTNALTASAMMDTCSPFCSPSNVVIRVHPGFICPKTLFFHFESKVLFLSKSNLASSVTCGLHLVVFHSFISWLYTVANDTPKSSSESLNYVKLFFLTMELLLPLSTLESCDQPLLCYLHHFPVFLSKGLYVRLISF